MNQPKALTQALRWRGTPLHLVAERNNSPSHCFSFEDSILPPDEDTSDHIKLHSKATWANIAHEAGLFASVGEARRAGWGIEIERGYTEAALQTRQGGWKFVFVFN